jgi:plastocyanin
MLPRRVLAVAAGSLLMLAACSSSTSSSPPASAAASAPASAPAATAPASAPASPAGSTAAACSTSGDAGAVTVSIKNFTFTPGQPSAKVGQVIKFSNDDSTAHTATLDDNACGTGNIDAGKANGLVFTAAGSYPFHCAIHPQMKGTITITE